MRSHYDPLSYAIILSCHTLLCAPPRLHHSTLFFLVYVLSLHSVHLNVEGNPNFSYVSHSPHCGNSITCTLLFVSLSFRYANSDSCANALDKEIECLSFSKSVSSLHLYILFGIFIALVLIPRFSHYLCCLLNLLHACIRQIFSRFSLLSLRVG